MWNYLFCWTMEKVFRKEYKIKMEEEMEMDISYYFPPDIQYEIEPLDDKLFEI